MISGYRTERRKFKRLRVSLSVLYRVMWPWAVLEQTQGQELEGQTLDLNEQGMALLSQRAFPLETKLFLKVIIFESNHIGEADFHEVAILYGQVRSSVLQADGKYRLGLWFEDMDGYQKMKIQDIMNSCLHHEPF